MNNKAKKKNLAVECMELKTLVWVKNMVTEKENKSSPSVQKSQKLSKHGNCGASVQNILRIASNIYFHFFFVGPNTQTTWHFCTDTALSFGSVTASQLSFPGRIYKKKNSITTQNTRVWLTSCNSILN